MIKNIITIGLLLLVYTQTQSTFAQNSRARESWATGHWEQTVIPDKTKELPMPAQTTKITLRENGDAYLENVRLGDKDFIELARGTWKESLNLLNVSTAGGGNVVITLKRKPLGVHTIKLRANTPEWGIVKLEAIRGENTPETLNPELYLRKSGLPSDIKIEGFTVERLTQSQEIQRPKLNLLGELILLALLLGLAVDSYHAHKRIEKLIHIFKDTRSEEQKITLSFEKNKMPLLVALYYSTAWILTCFLLSNINQSMQNATFASVIYICPLLILWYLSLKNYLYNIKISAKEINITNSIKGTNEINKNRVAKMEIIKGGPQIRPIPTLTINYKGKNKIEKTSKIPLVGFNNIEDLVKGLGSWKPL
jgi:hypothetical protein